MRSEIRMGIEFKSTEEGVVGGIVYFSQDMCMCNRSYMFRERYFLHNTLQSCFKFNTNVP